MVTTSRVGVARAAALDAVVILVFVTLGRRSHEEAETIAGVLATAAPFWIGAAAGWLAVRGDRRPTALLPTGVAAWAGAVVLGMLLRRFVAGDGTAASFVVVTTCFLGAFLLGWRALARISGRRRVA